MRRLLMVLTMALVMAAMMLAMAAPGFAQATHVSFPGNFNGEFCPGEAVFTPSGNINMQCKFKNPEGNNQGGSGGGGATVEEGTAHLGATPLEAHGVITPSGNGNLQGHYHPQGN